ncbi:MAG: GTPase Era [Bryobacteraceae bacterium]
MSEFRSGFVSILGRPNTGKSTLLNALVGSKVAIVADKPQTTRTAIQGVLTLPDAQVVFVDTPGIHKSDSLINRRMMETVRAELDERDLLLLMADASRGFGEEDRHAVDLVRKANIPTVLAVNKIDLVKDKRELLPVLDRYRELFDFAEYIPISATTRAGLDELKQAIVARLPEGPAYFPPDHVTDQPERFLGAELIRERILHETREEVPHSVAVLIDRWEDLPHLSRVYATILVEREGQKGILIGSKGMMMKRIGTMAREQMESLLGRRFFLDLRVKVQPNWRENPAFLNALDWRRMGGRDEF